MKTLKTILFTLTTYLCFGQKHQNSDVLFNLSFASRPAVVTVLSKRGPHSSLVNINNCGQVTFSDISPGQYKIQISTQGQHITIIDSIIILKGQKLILNFTSIGPCLYDHPADYIPTCPKNHIDSIIRIAYGLITRRGDTFINNKKEMKVKYGGCVTTGCDPQFYCKQHDIEF